MAQVSSTPSQEVFRASAPDIRAFAGLLRGVCFSNSNQKATMTIRETGIVVNVEEARSLSGTAWILKELFEEFILYPDGVHDEDEDMCIVLSFQLNTLLECLNIFGTASGSASNQTVGQRPTWRKPEEESGEDEQEAAQTSGRRRRDKNGQNNKIDTYFPRADGKGTGMRLSYAGEGHPLLLLLAESADGPTTSCELVTYEAEPQLDISLDRDNTIMSCILKSSWLRDALSEIDQACDKFTFIGVPADDARRGNINRPYLRIQANGPLGSTEMDFPEKDVLENFSCKDSSSFSYRFSHISRTLRAIQGSSKASLRIDINGVLSLQFLSMSPSPTNGSQVSSIVEFRCLSIEE